MTILVTNDDGIDARGLAVLEAIARRYGRVIVAAPDEEQSLCGHRLTTRATIRVSVVGPDRHRVYGTPADCVRLALTVFGEHVDWVWSGINQGGNLGADIYTSGTVAAAREAALLGRKALAISHYVARGRQIDWTAAEERAEAAIDHLLREPVQALEYWNVNLPHPAEALASCPIVNCAADPSPLDVRFRIEGEGYAYCGTYAARPRRPGSDIDRCFGGAITVTKLTLDGREH